MQRNRTLNPNIKYCLRIRPYMNQENMVKINDSKDITINDINKDDENASQKFKFDNIFPENANQVKVFDYLETNCIKHLIEGRNCCVFTYGQVGAGKSYSIFGVFDQKTQISYDTPDTRGLIPLTVEYLFKKQDEFKSQREFIIECQYFEMYLNQVRDLGREYQSQYELTVPYARPTKKQEKLSNGGKTYYEKENLEIMEDSNGQIIIRDLRKHRIIKPEEIYELLKSGSNCRTKYAMNPDLVGEKSHTVFTLSLIQKDRTNENLPFGYSTITFVDLAGSQRIAHAVINKDKNLQESRLINASLTILKNVMIQLKFSGNKGLPYRESKLTRALQNCLTTSCHIVGMFQISPLKKNFEECLATLQYSASCQSSKTVEKRVKKSEAETSFDMPQDANEQGFGNMQRHLKQKQEQINDLEIQYATIDKQQKDQLSYLEKIMGCHNLSKKLTKSNKGKVVCQ